MRWNIWDMPFCSSVPTSSPMQLSFSPKLSTAVDDALMPILCSIEPTWTSLEVPSERSRGTTNSDRPLVPAGASSVRASTRCRMFFDRS